MANRRAVAQPAQSDREQARPPKLFISYTQESSSQNKRVLALADELRENGFDCDLDQYHANEDWPAWMEHSIEQADHVLVVSTPIYRRRWNNQKNPGVGLGAQWESLLTRQHLYASPNRHEKFIPVVFQKDHIPTIPTPLAGVTRIELWRKSGFRKLQRRLLNIPPAAKPPLATSLAPIPVAEGFFAEKESLPKTRPAARQADDFDHSNYGLSDQPEILLPNLFAASYPPVIKNARITAKRGGKLSERVQRTWEELGRPGKLPVAYWIEAGIVYQLAPFTGAVWEALIQRRVLQPLPDKSTLDWAGSPNLEDRKRFIKLLNRSLKRPSQLLANPSIDDMAWIKIAKQDDKQALTKDLSLEL